jgi:hypothetical protein
MLYGDSAITNPSEISASQEHVATLGNSDRIRLKFGNYGIDIVENELRIRVSNLYSSSDGVKTNRTFAVVMYPTVIEPAFRKEHQAIIEGQSIGIVFREHGWQIGKRHQYIGVLNTLSDFSGIHSVFGDIGSAHPVIHVYSLIVKKDNQEFHYASISEVHHPEYLELEELKSIFEVELNGAQVKNQDTIDFLRIVKSKMQKA